MGVHAGQLALKSDLRLVQEYRRSLLPCLEQARRPTLDHHVYRSSGLGVWVLISEHWYKPMSGDMPVPAAATSSGCQRYWVRTPNLPLDSRTASWPPTGFGDRSA